MPNLRSFALAAVSLALAGAVLQSGTALAAPQGGVSPIAAEQSTHAAQADEWTPPPGYTFERLVPAGGEAGCRMVGDEGIAKGQWSDYVCRIHRLPHQEPWGWPSSLYVKK